MRRVLFTNLWYKQWFFRLLVFCYRWLEQRYAVASVVALVHAVNYKPVFKNVEQGLTYQLEKL